MKFDSKFEEDVYKDLLSRGVKVKHHPFTEPYIVKKNYTPDYLLPNNIVIETKGYHPKFKETCANILAFIRMHDDLDVRFVWASNNKWSKTMRLTDWCNKNGIKSAIGKVPQEWIEEPMRNLPERIKLKR